MIRKIIEHFTARRRMRSCLRILNLYRISLAGIPLTSFAHLLCNLRFITKGEKEIFRKWIARMLDGYELEFGWICANHQPSLYLDDMELFQSWRQAWVNRLIAYLEEQLAPRVLVDFEYRVPLRPGPLEETGEFEIWKAERINK